MNEVKRPKKPLFFYYTIVMLLILLGNLVLMPWMQQRQIEEVDYSKFISMTENKQIGKVQIKAQENEIIFTDKKDKDIIYKTGMVNDDELTKRLYESGAKFSGEIQRQTSPWVSLLMYWVHVEEDDGQGRWQLHDVRYGQEQRQDLRQILRRDQV